MRRTHAKTIMHAGDWFDLPGGFVANISRQRRRRSGVLQPPRFVVLCPLGTNAVRGFRRTLCAGDVGVSGEAQVTYGVLSDELRCALQSSDAFIRAADQWAAAR